MIYTTKTASITDLRQDATSLIEKLHEAEEPLFILQHSEVSAVMLDPKTYEELVLAYQDQKDYELGVEALKNAKEKVFTGKQFQAVKPV